MQPVADPDLLEKLNSSPLTEATGDTDPSVLGVAKQLPLGFARGTVNIPTGAAPVRGDPDALKRSAESKIPFLGATVGEAIKRYPALVKHYEKTNEALPATTDEYAKPIREATGLTPDLEPKNLPERMASGAGEALPWAAMMGPSGLAGNLAMSGVGGAGGVLAEEFVEDKDKPLANIAGNLIGSLGMAGVMRLAQGIINLGRRYRTLPGDAAEFQIPATKGMIGEEAGLAPEAVQKQLSLEEGMSRGSQGWLAQKIMERNRLAREGAIAKAGDDIEVGMGGPRTTPDEAGELVGHGLKTEAGALRSAGDEAYNAAAKKAAWAETSTRPSRVVENALERENVFLDDFGNYPMSHTAMKIISKLDKGSGAQPAMSATGLVPGPQTTFSALPISVQDINQARKAINQLKASRPEDGRGLTHIKKAFDAWERDLIDNALFTGDKSVIDDLKRGRELWHRYRSMTDANPKLDYSKVISDIVEKDRTPTEVANWLLNVSSHQSAGRASRLARYIERTFTRDSDEFQSLRQAFVHKAMNPEGAQQGHAAIARAIESSINGKGAPLARALFEGPEIERLRRYAAALRRVSPRLENPPNSGWVNTRYLWSLINAGSGAAGLAGAYHTGDKRWLALGVVPFVKNYRSAMKAIEATTQTKKSPALLQRGLALGAASGVDEYEGRQ